MYAAETLLAIHHTSHTELLAGRSAAARARRTRSGRMSTARASVRLASAARRSVALRLPSSDPVCCAA